MEVEEPNYGELPRREILMDWGQFARLPDDEKELFVKMAESLERGGWCSRTGYDGICDWACVDLSEYTDYGALVEKLKKQGPTFYEARKAEKRGYYSKFFDEQTFVGDIVAINTSTSERQGKPMEGSTQRTVAQRGGYSMAIREAEIPAHQVFWLRKFGTFRHRPGHCQGPIIVDEQLVSFLSLRRFGNFVNYNLLLGHKELLKDGIVHKMHVDLVNTLLGARNRAMTGTGSIDTSLLGIRYISYGSSFGTTPGLRRWKKSNLFTPGLTMFDFSPALKYSKS
jgi:hypothetical protein